MKHESVITVPTPDHTAPLIVFTTMAVLGAGLITSPGMAALASRADAGSRLLVPGILLLAGGLLVSLAHVGRLSRTPRAIARVGRSPLSTEVALAAATLLATAAAIAAPSGAAWTRLAASACSLAFLLAVGLVYNLPGQQTWRGGAVLSPLAMGLIVGTIGIAALTDEERWILPIAAAALALDLTVLALRAVAIERTCGSASVQPHWYRRRRGLLAARCALVDVVPAGLLFAGLDGGALAALSCLGLGVLVDRLAFYKLAAQRTTEAEIASVEASLACLP